jgi:hypothetical protein
VALGTIAGFGVGGVLVPPSTIAITVCPDRLIATTVALSLSIRVIGGSIGYLAVSTWLANRERERDLARMPGEPDAKKGRKGGGSKGAVKCDHCGKQGHEIDSCLVKHPEKRPPRTEPKGKRGAKKDNSKNTDNESDSALSVVALSTKSGLDRHSWCLMEVLHCILRTHVRISTFTL